MNWPKSDTASMNAFYGPVGSNQTTLNLPYPMKIAWRPFTRITKITCHIKVADSLRRILAATLVHYGQAKISEMGLDLFGGCLCVRKMRGGTNWSKHSWGAAIDFDPDRNQLSWSKSKANMAKREFIPFWDIVAGEGWVSLGQMQDRDYMHIEATRWGK